MKRILRIYLTLLISLCASSCYEVEGDLINDSLLIDGSSQEQALATFNAFVNNITNTDVKSESTGSIEVLSIRKVRPDVKSGPELPLYEVNFQIEGYDSQGFALIGEYNIVDEVLAYVPVGALADTTFNIGLSIFMNDLTSALNHCTIMTKDGGENMKGNIFYLPDYDESIRLRELTFTEAYRYGSMSPFVQDTTVIYDYLMAEVPTKWGQSAPYSNKALKSDGTIGKVGCVPVAIGQVMAYHRKPETYDWDLMLLSPSVSSSEVERSDSVSSLLYDIAIAAGTNFSTGGSSPKAKLTALQNFGYSGIYTDYGDSPNYNIPFWELFSDYTAPILMGGQRDGGGHAWVVDGILQQTRWYCDVETINNQDGTSVYYLRTFPVKGHLVHCNWGWSGQDDGWYYEFHTDTSFRYYYCNKNMVSQISYYRK